MRRMIFILVPARSVGTQRERFAHVRSQRQSVGTGKAWKQSKFIIRKKQLFPAIKFIRYATRGVKN